MEYYGVVLKGESLSHHGILGMKWGVRRFQNPDGTLTEEGKRRYRITESGEIQKLSRKERKEADESAKKAEWEKTHPVEALASKTKTFLGDADETFSLLAQFSYDDLTNYGHHKGNAKYNKLEFEDLFRRAFGDDPEAQRQALKLTYASVVTRYMDEESSDPLSSDVFGRYTDDASRPRDRENRNEDLSVGDSWGREHEDEWRGYMEDNVKHPIKPLSSDERIEALRDSGLYDDDDLNHLRKLNHEDLAGDFLAHYGILGMKWGVRRYQNMDGTLTPEGKAKRDAYLEKHYGKATKKLERIDAKYKKRQAKADKKFVKAQKKEFSPFSSLESADKAHEKAMRAQKRANMTIAKGKKWSDQMIKEFSKTGMTIDPKTVKMNEDYTNRMLMIAESMYSSNIHKRR